MTSHPSVSDPDDRAPAPPGRGGPVGAPRKLPEVEDFPATGPNSLAAPGPRFGARGLDLVIVLLPAVVVGALGITAEAGQPLEIDLPSWLPWMILGVGLAYEVVLVALWGRTVGKWAFGLRVARYTDGRRPQPAQALLRGLLPWSVFVLPAPFGFAFLLGVWGTGIGGSLHRGLPDQAGGTVVIATR